MNKLWKDLKLDNNEIFCNNPNIRKFLYTMLNEIPRRFVKFVCTLTEFSIFYISISIQGIE